METREEDGEELDEEGAVYGPGSSFASPCRLLIRFLSSEEKRPQSRHMPPEDGMMPRLADSSSRSSSPLIKSEAVVVKGSSLLGGAVPGYPAKMKRPFSLTISAPKTAGGEGEEEQEQGGCGSEVEGEGENGPAGAEKRVKLQSNKDEAENKSGGGPPPPLNLNGTALPRSLSPTIFACADVPVLQQLAQAQAQLAMLEKQQAKLMQLSKRGRERGSSRTPRGKSHSRSKMLTIKIPRTALLLSRGQDAGVEETGGAACPPMPAPPSPGLSLIFGRKVTRRDMESLSLGDIQRRACGVVSHESLTPLARASPPELVDHVRGLRLDFLARNLRPVLHRLMTSSNNRGGLFNIPVDPEALQIPDYRERIAHPMDLGTIKERLQSLLYSDPNQFAGDVRLVFQNAMVFNPPTHPIHQYASQLLADFDGEFARLSERLERTSIKRSEHNCQLCQGQTCAVCGDKCLRLEPPVLMCHGPCNQRIKRGGTFHISRDASRLWCQKCFQALPQNIPEDPSEEPRPTSGGPVAAGQEDPHKSTLLKRKFDYDVNEPWVQCDRCEAWVHQVCALFNARANAGEAKLSCPICQLKDTAVALAEESSSGGGGTNFDKGAGGPAAVGTAAPTHQDQKESASAAVYFASDLPQTPMSRYIERRVAHCLEALGEGEVVPTLSIRVVSNIAQTCEVPSVVQKAFCCGGGDGDEGDDKDVPAEIPYRSKALCMFQRVDGADVCLYTMYVQEYGKDAPPANARRVYIAYLDSVEFFRPRAARTHVYHEILASYLDWARRRGFRHAHIWSCPPQRGNNFIFWCHPSHQRTPTRERLVDWYRSMLRRCEALGIVTSVDNLHSAHFQDVTRTLHLNRQQAQAGGVEDEKPLPLEAWGRPPVPPVLDGDFWVDEVIRLHKLVERKRDADFVAEQLSPRELCLAALEELMSMPQCSPFCAPVDPLAHCCLDYLDIIKHPMDLGQVKARLEDGHYSTAHYLAEDVRLTFSNCIQYNPPSHPLHSGAKHLLGVFERSMKRIQRLMKARLNRLVTLKDILLEESIEEVELAGAERDPMLEALTPRGLHKHNASGSFTGEHLTRTYSSTGFHGSMTRMNSASSFDAGGPETPSQKGFQLMLRKGWNGIESLLGCGGERMSVSHSGASEKQADESECDEYDEMSRGGNPQHTAMKFLSKKVLPPAPCFDGTMSCDVGYAPPSDQLSEADSGDPGLTNAGSATSSGCRSAGISSKEAQQVVHGNKMKWVLSQLCKSVDRMKRDLLVVHLASADARLLDAEWEHAVPIHLDGFDPEGCTDPDPAHSRALVDSRHTFLEMCQFRHYQFDTLRRAKHSSAMVLYHLHRPQAHSLNPFCSRCSEAIRSVRFHCSLCSVDLCSSCQQHVDYKCEEGHPLTPFRVTFAADESTSTAGLLSPAAASGSPDNP